MRRRPFVGTASPLRSVVVLVVICACSALLTACGGRAASSSLPTPGQLPTVRHASDIALPLDHYLPTPPQRAELATARSELVSRCMSRLGFAGYPVDSYEARVTMPLHGNTYGVLDADVARARGFKPTFLASIEAEQADMDHRFAQWGGADVLLALQGRAPTTTSGSPESSAPSTASTTASGASASPSGIPAGGCQAQGERDLFALVGAQPPRFAWMENLEGAAVQQAQSDPRMGPVTRAWSACLGTEGYHYAAPRDLEDDPQYEDASNAAAARRVAQADVRCKWSSRFVDTWVALTAAYEDRQIEANAEALQGELDARQRVLASLAGTGLGRVRRFGES